MAELVIGLAVVSTPPVLFVFERIADAMQRATGVSLQGVEEAQTNDQSGKKSELENLAPNPPLSNRSTCASTSTCASARSAPEVNGL
jgi:hypothetical protein